MPVDEVRRVLQASDVASRNEVIVAHLDRMHRQLEQTQATVASLQALLSGQLPPEAPVEIRRLPAAPVLLTRATVAFDDCAAWLEAALADLHATASSDVAGPDGALYSDEFFADGAGDVTAFVPVTRSGAGAAELPATTAAVLVHDGPFADLDRAYATLGTVVAERGIGGPGPIREHYLSAARTEVCWPVKTA